MFGQLLESRATPVRNRAGTVVSVVAHGVFIALAVVATRTQLIADGPKVETVSLPILPPDMHRPVETRSAERTSTTQPGSPAPPVVRVPDVVLPGLPPIDLSAPTPTEIAWSRDDVRRPATNGAGASGGAHDGIPFAPDVDKPAIARPGNPAPRYPEILRRAHVTGEVVVQVVIDTTGVADMSTVRVMSSAHPLLTDAVLAALARARFVPAETGGRKVRMWAVQSFVFEMAR